MKKLQLTKANPGNYSKDKPVLELVKSFNNGLVEISDERIYIKTNDNKTFTSSLKKTEEDFISETFQGTYEDGTSFRLIKPSGVAKQIMSLQGQGESISFGGMTGDGYAVHFNIVEINAPDSNDYSESRDTEFTSAIESKAETLVMTADSLHEFNPKMAKEHISRFMNLLSENEIELVKFEHVQNIIYGFVLAIRLNLIDEDTANKRLNEIRLRFASKDHSRFENGIHVSGPHGGAGRVIEIIPNFELKEGYLVTIYNQDSLHPVWGNNIQMAPKQMKVVRKSETEIELRGFGHDMFGNSFSDYGMTLKLYDGELEKCTLHMFDRNIDIEYQN
ncbi:MAG TPA: hypothetical protein PLG11_07570 [Bacteroidales bacterium]|jgi:hypothetical protein|nr:hypothetical protein [Bacteroidales bacterium]HOC16055.1 hypothetical protein [Bacteroidales bacterium]HPN49466.1 hypothetical protein [Bacteroidales bacterium]HQB25772.1 hypothetical protein [Bacteroidales bacterium]HQL07438.1 hypothetical protein [Bacteroidales bacterium]